MNPLPELSPSSPAWWRRNKAWPVVLVLSAFLLMYFPLQRASSAERSATNDEPLHLTAGYVALKDGDFRYDPTHPPLLRMIAASALMGRMSRPVDLTGIGTMDFFAWTNHSFQAASEFIYGEPDADALLEAARFRIMLLGALLGMLLFGWVYECMGLFPAALSLGLYLISPNLAGHATLVTTDIGVTCFLFGSVYFLWRLQRRYSAANVVGLAGFTALAMVSKYSAFLLGPILGLLLVIAARRDTAITARRACLVFGLVSGACFLAIWAVYGFRFLPSQVPDVLIRTDGLDVVRQHVPLLSAVGNWIDARHLLPNAYTQGFLLSQASAEALPAFLNGEIREGGWWYYFPVAFVLKTPVAILILLAAGLTGMLWPGAPDPFRLRAFVLLPAVVYMAFAMASGVNLGVRHILPVYPFVLLITATAIRELIRARQAVAHLGLATVLALAAFRYQQVWPNTLTFFNSFAGGPRNGGRHLTDSNLDWGQHLKTLKEWMQVKGVGRINFAYSGTTDPARFGIEGVYLPGSPAGTTIGAPRLPGYVAISTTILSGVYLPPEIRLLYSPFANRNPDAVIGNSIYVYWLERWPVRNPGPDAAEEDLAAYILLGDGFLFGIQEPANAIPYYDAFLSVRPADSEVLFRTGYAHLRLGDKEQSESLMQRAITRSENPARQGAKIALALVRSGYNQEGMRYARQAVQFSPGDATVHDTVGIALALQGRDSEAAAAFDRALALNPADPDFQAHAAEIRRPLVAGPAAGR